MRFLFFARDPTGGRPLTESERAIARRLFGAALDPDPVRLHRAKWFPFQARDVTMAPDGHIWFHPEGGLWRDDFGLESAMLRALLVHELTHVWQHQRGLCLPLRRWPFARYDYALTPGRPLERYGIEQQAMIVQHGWERLRTATPLGPYMALLPATRDAISPPEETS
jgi:hypothetical protein